MGGGLGMSWGKSPPGAQSLLLGVLGKLAESIILYANRKDMSVLPCCSVSYVSRHLEQVTEVMVLFGLRMGINLMLTR